MSTIEEDVERVRAVTAVLGEPLQVWIIGHSDRHGEATLGVYSTVEKCKAKLREHIDNDLLMKAINGAEHEHMVEQLKGDDNPCAEEREIFYNYDCHEVDAP